MNKYSVLLLLALLNTFPLWAASGDDFMRSMGKMYVVVAVIVASFVGMVFYLIRLDNKLTKLEHQIKEHE